MLGLGLTGESHRRQLLPSGPLDLLLRHCLGPCPRCEKRLRELDRLQEEVGYPDPVVVVEEGPRARRLWSRLAGVPASLIKQRLHEKHFFWGMASLLLAESRKSLAVSVRRAATLAEAAVGVATLLNARYYTPELVADLQARAWAALGNARRVQGDLAGAEKVFGNALSRLRCGTRTALVRATVLDLLGSLRIDQRRFGEAAEALESAAMLYDQAGQGLLVGKVQLKLSRVDDFQGDVEGAVVHLTTALGLIDESEDRTLYAHCQHHLLHQLIVAGHLAEAELRLPAVYGLWSELGHRRNLVLVRWMEGRLHQGIGELERAEEVFREVIESFEAQKVHYWAAVVRLDLACVHAERGHSEACSRVAAEALVVLREKQVGREALAALTLLEQARSERRLDAAALKAVVTVLARAGKASHF